MPKVLLVNGYRENNKMHGMSFSKENAKAKKVLFEDLYVPNLLMSVGVKETA